MTEGPLLQPPLFGAYAHDPRTSMEPARTLADAVRVHITKTLQRTNWVVGGRAGAAAKLALPGQPSSLECASLEFRARHWNRGPRGPVRCRRLERETKIARAHLHTQREYNPGDLIHQAAPERAPVFSKLAVSVMLVLKSFDTGQPAFAAWYAWSKACCVAPGILAFSSRWLSIIANPPSFLSSVTCTSCPGCRL